MDTTTKSASNKASEDDRSSKSASMVPSISLPKGGGAIHGIGEKFAANPVTGTGSFSVPIATSPGRSGFGPQLSLAYDSGAGNGPFGFGWNLSLPSITRKTDKGLPRYQDADDSDVYLLSGAEDLVPVPGSGYKDETTPPDFMIQRYRPRIEGLFARIERWTNQQSGAIHWRSISRDNITTLYGTTEETRIFDPHDENRIFTWLICESYDDKGNAIVYEYGRENDTNVDRTQANERNRVRTANRYLKRIKYGNVVSRLLQPDLTAANWMFEVDFDYDEGRFQEIDLDPDRSESKQHRLVRASAPVETPPTWAVRPDPFSSHRAGFEVRTYRRCHRVLMFHNFAELGPAPYLVRSTEFKYDDLNYLQTTTVEDELAYHGSTRFASFIHSATQSGFVRDDTQADGITYLRKSLPPLEFEYSKAVIQEDICELDAASLENLPIGLDGSAYQWVDLDGEGLSGILTEQADAWFYKRNLGEAHFGPLERVATKPSLAALNSGRQQLLDLAGDGQLDLVAFAGPTPGFFERAPDQDWQTFIPFESLPNLAWNDPNLRFVDLNGDGHADVLISENDALTWYPSLAEEGFAPAQQVRAALDEEQGPRLVFADGTQSIYLADMSADGLTDLVRVRNGEVCYWPNLGYGRFGARVVMDDAPWFDAPDQFNQQHVRLADIDGSGATDLIYLGHEGVCLYFNQSGNRWSAPRSLGQFPPIDNLSSVMTVDLLGNGTACLVWSSPVPGNACHPLHYIDLMGGQKPHLLVSVKNNLGAETLVQYAPSTKFYLADQEAGKPWITKLPFPVHCVEKVTVTDKWRNTCFATTYSYHHGYFDGAEREFRGFGRVEQVDVESFREFAANNIASPCITTDQTLFQPPVKTITWYHTGTALDRQRILTQFATEYFPARYPQQGGIPEKVLPEPDLDPELNAEEWREALRACKGMVLRQEIYELDVDALHAEVPTEVPVRLFLAATHNCHIRRLQLKGDNRHAVFLVTESEALSYHYELDLRITPSKPDPRIAHTLNLRHDEYGNPQQSVAIAYGRVAPGQNASLPRADLIDQVQAETHVAYSETRYTEDVVLPKPIAGQNKTIKHHRLRLPCEMLTYELKGIDKADTFYYALADFHDLDLSEQYGHEDLATAPPPLPVERKEYHEHADGLVAQKRIVEHTRTLYFDDESDTLPPTFSRLFGHHGPRGLKYEDYKLALTEALLDAVFQQRDPQTGALLDDKLNWELEAGVSARDKLDTPVTLGSPHLKSGYILGIGIDANLSDQYWIRSGIAGFATDAARHFYLPERYTDPFGNITTLQYDPLDLFVQSSQDALGNTTGILVDPVTGKARFDYRVLAPLEMVDLNGNHSEVRFDVLGLVVAAALKGKWVNGHWEGDHLDDFTDAIANPLPANVVAFCTDNTLDKLQARDWLASASTRFVYHFGDENGLWAQWMAGACGIQRERHASQVNHDPLLDPDKENPLQVSLECSDGTGNVLMKKVQAEPDPDSTAADPLLRWIVNGLTVLNNKGNPVKQFQPKFSPNFGCELPQANGVTPVMFYDAVGRLVRTEMPDGTFSRVEFSPWHVLSFDANDTINEPNNAWYAKRVGVGASDEDMRAAKLSLVHQDTPALTILDSLGREVIAIAYNRLEDANGTRTIDGKHYRDERYLTFTKLDAEAKPLWIRDARGNLVMQYIRPIKPTRAIDEVDKSKAEDIPANSVPCYDIAGNLLYQHSMDAGDRWMLMDAAGKPTLAWDFNRQQEPTDERRLYFTEYDALHRPTKQWLRINDDAPTLIERFEYRDTKKADGTPNPQLTPDQAANLIGQLVRHYDPSGLIQVERIDFKGSPLEVQRRLVSDPTTSVTDWQSDHNADGSSKLEAESFIQITEYDALKRMTRLYNWHQGIGSRVAVYEPQYNERGLLLSEQLVVRAKRNSETGGKRYDEVFGVTLRNEAIKTIRYDAKGQKEYLLLGNDTITRYEYDPLTFRLRQLRTTRPTYDPPFPGYNSDLKDLKVLQQLLYTYDSVGNFTEIVDEAYKTVFFQNALIEARSQYEYDALYRLIKATGREDGAATGAPPQIETKPRDVNFPILDSNALRKYTQIYQYDSVGNIKQIRHLAGAIGSWTRDYAYAYEDLTQPASNRLWQTWIGADRANNATTYKHDTHGNILNLNRIPDEYRMQWDYRDMIGSIDLGGGGDTYYQYDAGKQRTRKRIKNKNNAGYWERISLGGYELYRRSVDDNVVEEIESHHLFEGRQRVLLVDDVVKTNRTHPDGREYKTDALFRYQYSNHLGSACLELDDHADIVSYEEYHPYGTSAYRATKSGIEAQPKRYRFTGMERDEESGLSYHGARYMSPWLVIWLSCDPKAPYEDLNCFRYVHGNPLKFLDPNGTQAIPATPEQMEFVRKRMEDFSSLRLSDTQPIVLPDENHAHVMRMMPDGTFLIDESSASARKSRDISTQMAYARANKTGANITGGAGGALGYFAGGDSGSDRGAFWDAMLISVTPHPLNTQQPVNVPSNATKSTGSISGPTPQPSSGKANKTKSAGALPSFQPEQPPLVAPFAAKGSSLASMLNLKIAAVRKFFKLSPSDTTEVGLVLLPGFKQPVEVKSGHAGGPWLGTQLGSIPRGKGSAYSSGGPSESNIGTHVEGHAIQGMWATGSKKGVLVVGSEPCGVCDPNIPSALPPGSQLVVIHPDKANPGEWTRTVYRSNR